MLDVNLLRSKYFRGPLTEEQQSELFAVLKNAGIFLAFRTIYAGGWTNIPSHFKEIKFEDLYIPEENMEFSEELSALLEV